MKGINTVKSGVTKGSNSLALVDVSGPFSQKTKNENNISKSHILAMLYLYFLLVGKSNCNLYEQSDHTYSNVRSCYFLVPHFQIFWDRRMLQTHSPNLY